MRTRALLAVTAAFAAVLAISGGAYAFDSATPPNQRNAILFSWDGVQRNHLYECLTRSELPNLAKLIAEGKLVNIDVVGHQSDTKSGHTQMLTGYEPEITRVYSNANFRPIPVGHTIFENLSAQFGKDRIATIMLTGKGPHIGSKGPPKKAEGADETADTGKAKKPARGNIEGEPWHLVKANFTVWDGDKPRPASEVGPKCLGYIDKYGSGRFFAFFHFSDPDHTGHAHGENSKEHNDAIILCDSWLGKIVEALKSKGVYEETLVYVTSDHGFDEGKKTHKQAPYVFLVASDASLVKDGDQRDVVPTILKAMGADLDKVTPKLPGKVLTLD